MGVNSSASYEVPGILPEIGWKVILQSEQKRIDRERYLPLYLCNGLLFYFILLWYCVSVTVVSSIGTAFPRKSGGVIILFYFCTHYQYCK